MFKIVPGEHHAQPPHDGGDMDRGSAMIGDYWNSATSKETGNMDGLQQNIVES